MYPVLGRARRALSLGLVTQQEKCLHDQQGVRSPFRASWFWSILHTHRFQKESMSRMAPKKGTLRAWPRISGHLAVKQPMAVMGIFIMLLLCYVYTHIYMFVYICVCMCIAMCMCIYTFVCSQQIYKHCYFGLCAPSLVIKLCGSHHYHTWEPNFNSNWPIESKGRDQSVEHSEAMSLNGELKEVDILHLEKKKDSKNCNVIVFCHIFTTRDSIINFSHISWRQNKAVVAPKHYLEAFNYGLPNNVGTVLPGMGFFLGWKFLYLDFIDWNYSVWSMCRWYYCLCFEIRHDDFYILFQC